jgi:hypothetical protein
VRCHKVRYTSRLHLATLSAGFTTVVFSRLHLSGILTTALPFATLANGPSYEFKRTAREHRRDGQQKVDYNSRVSENSLCANSRCTRLGILARTGTRGVGRERRYASPAAAILLLPFYRLLLLLLPLLCLLQQLLFLLFVGAHQLSGTVPSVRVVNLHMNRTIKRQRRECITIKTGVMQLASEVQGIASATYIH